MHADFSDQPIKRSQSIQEPPESSTLSAAAVENKDTNSRVHSYYHRSPRDLPTSGQAVPLRLRVRRFRCLNAQCLKKTFAEPLPALITPSSKVSHILSTDIVVTSGELLSHAPYPEILLPLATFQQMYKQGLHQPIAPNVLCIRNTAQGSSQIILNLLQQIFQVAPLDPRYHIPGTTQFDTVCQRQRNSGSGSLLVI